MKVSSDTMIKRSRSSSSAQAITLTTHCGISKFQLFHFWFWASKRVECYGIKSLCRPFSFHLYFWYLDLGACDEGLPFSIIYKALVLSSSYLLLSSSHLASVSSVSSLSKFTSPWPFHHLIFISSGLLQGLLLLSLFSVHITNYDQDISPIGITTPSNHLRRLAKMVVGLVSSVLSH